MPVQPGAHPFSADGGPVAVLLLHGFTGSPHSLRAWGEHHAAAGLTVRVPRLPGHGTSWQELNRTRWEDWYAAAERELLALRAAGHRVVVGGLSVGGALAVRLAEVHPADVDGLVVVNPSVADDEDLRKRFLWVLRWVLPSFPGLTDDIALPGVTEQGYDRAPLHAGWSVTRLWAAVRGDLAAVACPVLVLRSRVDNVVPASSTQTLLAGISSADVAVVELTRSRHVATLDHDAGLIRERSLAFVRRVTEESDAATGGPAGAPVDDRVAQPGPRSGRQPALQPGDAPALSPAVAS